MRLWPQRRKTCLHSRAAEPPLREDVGEDAGGPVFEPGVMMRKQRREALFCCAVALLGEESGRAAG